MKTSTIEKAYALAREAYAAWEINTDTVMDRLVRTPISLHCWQGDDVGGFEHSDSELGGGLAVDPRPQPAKQG